MKRVVVAVDVAIVSGSFILTPGILVILVAAVRHTRSKLMLVLRGEGMQVQLASTMVTCDPTTDDELLSCSRTSSSGSS